jgi:hypothetical protein
MAGPMACACQISSRGFICSSCGKRGTDVRPDFNKPVMPMMGYR